MTHGQYEVRYDFKSETPLKACGAFDSQVEARRWIERWSRNHPAEMAHWEIWKSDKRKPSLVQTSP